MGLKTTKTNSFVAIIIATNEGITKVLSIVILLCLFTVLRPKHINLSEQGKV